MRRDLLIPRSQYRFSSSNAEGFGLRVVQRRACQPQWYFLRQGGGKQSSKRPRHQPYRSSLRVKRYVRRTKQHKISIFYEAAEGEIQKFFDVQDLKLTHSLFDTIKYTVTIRNINYCYNYIVQHWPPKHDLHQTNIVHKNTYY